MDQLVYLDQPGTRSLQGPYLIASVPKQGRYTLSFEDGDRVENGKEFDENMLVEAD